MFWLPTVHRYLVLEGLLHPMFFIYIQYGSIRTQSYQPCLKTYYSVQHIFSPLSTIYFTISTRFMKCEFFFLFKYIDLLKSNFKTLLHFLKQQVPHYLFSSLSGLLFFHTLIFGQRRQLQSAVIIPSLEKNPRICR